MPARLRTAPWRLQSNKADGAEGCSNPLRHGKRVRCWHEADVTRARRDVRFQGESGHNADWLPLPSLTQNGLPGTSAVRLLSGGRQTFSKPYSSSLIYEHASQGL